MKRILFKRLNKKFLFYSITVMLFFQLISISAAVSLHELSHKSDYKNITLLDSSLCLPFQKCSCGENSMACFKIEYPLYEENKIIQIQKFTEVKAYSISNAVLFLYLFCCLIFLDKNQNKFKEVK